MGRVSWAGFMGAVALAVAACGGQVDPGGDGGTGSSSSSGGVSSGSSSGAAASGSSGGGGGTSSSGVTVPPCPSEPPSPGMACAGPQGCAYFTHSGCEAFLCSDSNVWQSTPEGC